VIIAHESFAEGQKNIFLPSFHPETPQIQAPSGAHFDM
jgi:hypothetical protein